MHLAHLLRWKALWKHCFPNAKEDEQGQERKNFGIEYLTEPNTCAIISHGKNEKFLLV